MPARRSTLLIAGALGALGFVVLRVLYRIIFGGASSGETALPSLPRLPLGGPFSHIQLFGPVTLEGLTTAALSAIPFAAVILVTASLVAVFDPRKLLSIAPQVPVGKRIVVALGIAFSTFPLVLGALQHSRRSARLRGVKPGFGIFTPVLEITLERSREIAEALEVRGIVAGTQVRSAAEEHRELLALEKFCVEKRMVAPVSVGLQPHDAVVLTGATGSGKTTLLRALAGVLHHQGDVNTSGLLRTGPVGHCGYLPHNPRSIFLTTRVIDDVALGLVARGVSRSEAVGVAETMLAGLGISDLAEHAPWELSSGEAVMAALAVCLITQPTILLLDEPLSALDAHHRAVFQKAVLDYCDAHLAAVVMSDHPDQTASVPGFQEMVLGPEGLVPGRFVKTVVAPTRWNTVAVEGDVIATLRGVSRSFGGRVVVDSVSCDIHLGEILVITGDNGAGKSTLLNALAMPAPNTVSVRGIDLSRVADRKRVRHLALVPSEPSDLFMTSSVAEELTWADRVAGVEPGFTRLTLESLLPEPWHHEVLGKSDYTHPRDLSRGQQAALAIAVQLSHKPAVLALDEPTRGLDHAAREAFSEVVACVVETGTACVLASHHAELPIGLKARFLVLDNGSLRPKRVGVTP